MIRINLHPIRAQKKVQAGKRQLLFFAMIVVGELAVMALLLSWQNGQIDEKRQEGQRLDARIAQLKREVGDFDQLKAQRDRLISQRNIINQLQKARTGPVWMMRELSDILTKGKGPTVDQTQYEMLLRRDPNAGFNPRWNPKRLWITGFSQKGPNVHLTGKAKDYDDVAEFNKRISLSKYFTNDFLERNDQMFDGQIGLKVVRFSLRCRVTYK
jgi:type IV pilus assembly protein PilN